MASDVIQDLQIKIKAIVSGQEGLDILDTALEEIEKRKKAIDKLSESDADWAKASVAYLKEEQAALEKILNLKKKAEEVEKKSSKFKTDFASSFSQSRYIYKLDAAKESGLGGVIGSKLAEVLDSAIDKLKKVFEDAWTEFNNIVSQSFLSNAQTRSNVFGYGMSLGQSYAFEKVKGTFGISSLEEAAYFTGEQAKLFSEAMTHYTEKYNQLYDEGFFTKQLEYDMKLQELQDDVKYVLIDFFIENQDTIMAAMNGVLQIANWVLSRFSAGSAADIVNSYTNNKNVQVDLSYNLNGQVDKTAITNAGEQTVMMLVKAIKNS